MSDYLNRLVDRTLHLSPVVQPRLASLFEPPPTAAEPETATMLETKSTPGDSQSSAAAPEVSLPTQASRPALSDPVGVTDAPMERKTTSPADRGRVDQPIELPAPLVPPPLPETDLMTTRVIAAEPRAVREERPAHSSITEAMKSSSDPENHQTRLVKEEEVRPESPVKNRQPVQPTLIGPKPPAMTIPYAATQPVRTTRRESAQASIPAEGPETVVVTIGRVDVRAVFTPPAATSRSNRPEQAKPMSLDEYLKQQSEGRR
jgi:hypothetical protein